MLSSNDKHLPEFFAHFAQFSFTTDSFRRLRAKQSIGAVNSFAVRRASL